MNSNFRLEKIEITAFGKLKNVVITPTGGINMLNLPNESGKSTLAAFIKYVFYGFTGTKKQMQSSQILQGKPSLNAADIQDIGRITRFFD